MPNGRPCDNPISDILLHGKHLIPIDMEEMIRKLHSIDPKLVDGLEVFISDWEWGSGLEEGRILLEMRLAQHLQKNKK